MALLALIAAAVAPASLAQFQTLNGNFQAADIVAIILYAIVMGLTAFIAFIYLANLWNYVDTKYMQIYNDVGELFKLSVSILCGYFNFKTFKNIFF